MREKTIMPSDDDITQWNKEWATINKNEIANFEDLLNEHDKFLCKKAVNWSRRKLHYQESNPFMTGGRDID